MADTYAVSYTPDSQTSSSSSSDSAPMLAIQAGPSYTCKIATIKWAYSGLTGDGTALDLGLQQVDLSNVRRTNVAGGRFHKVQRRNPVARRDIATARIALAQPLERQSFTWNTYVAPGTYRWIAIVENQDVTAYSSPFTVTDSGDSSCVDTTVFVSSSSGSSVAAVPSSSADAFTSSAAGIASSISASSAAVSSASAAPAATTTAAAGLGSSSADTSSSSQHSGISSGGVAAAIVVPLLLIAAAVVLYLRRRASRADAANEKSGGSGSWKEKFLGGGAAASGRHMRQVSSPFDPRQHTGLSSQGAQAGMRRADAGDVLPGTDGPEWVDFSATNSPDAQVLSPGQFAHIPEGTATAARNSAFSDSIVVGDVGLSGGLYQHHNASLARDSALSGAVHGHSRFDSYSTAGNVRPSSLTSHTSAAQEESDAAEAAALQRSVSSASTLQVHRKPVPGLEDTKAGSKHYSSAARSSMDPYSLPDVSSPTLPGSAFPDASPFSDAHAAASPVADEAHFGELSAPARPFASSDARDSHISGVPDNVHVVDTPVLHGRSSPTSPTSRTLVTADSSEDLASPPRIRGDYHLSVNMDKGFRVSF